MNEDSYYTTLGVDEDATQEEIKSAFRKLSKKHHPDTENGNVRKFQRINEAYQVLKDPEKRKEYDWKRKAGSQDTYGRGGSYSSSFGGYGHQVDPREFFDDFVEDFRRREKERKKKKRKVLHLYLDFEDVLKDQSYEVSNVYEHGKDSYTVEVPSGIENGSERKVDSNYNIWVRINVADPEEFDRRDGVDVWKRVEISPLRSIIGGKIEIKNPHGKKVTMKIPRGTKDGETFKISGHGIQSWNKENGDLFVDVEIGDLELTEEQIDKLQSFVEKRGWNTAN